MQVIHKANEDIAKLWNEGKVKPERYRLLTYLIPVEIEGGKLLHNAVTGELIFLDAEETKNLSALPCEYAPWMDELIKKHFLVREGLDDKKTVDTLRRAWQIGDNPKEITGYTILPTTNCNARCFYCYEAGCKHENMTDATADKLVDFIEAHHGTKPVHIGWFGGEPLVGMKQIDRICKALKDRNIPFSSSMISNGYLFDEALTARVKEDWKLTNIQITLDGTEQVYNDTKAYVSPCESPYKRVLNNIELLLQNEIRVAIRLNLGLHNADDLNDLADELAAQFENKRYLSVYSHILFDDCGFEKTHFAEDELAVLHEKQEALTEKLRAFSFASSIERLPLLKKTGCMADNPNSVVVVPTGMLGKCEHYIDRNLVGSLDTGITNMKEIKLYRECIVYPQCEKCPIYPTCIKLKCCEPDRPCNDFFVKARHDGAKHAIVYYYEEFLRGIKKTTASDEAANC